MQVSPAVRAQQDMLWGVFAHLGGLLFGPLAPLGVWLAWRRRSPFLARSAKEALNMQISFLVYLVVALVCVTLGFGIALPVVVVTWFVLMVLATRRVARLEDHRYPGIFRLLS